MEMGSLLIKRIILLSLFLSCYNIWLIANDEQNQTAPLYKDSGSEELQNFKNIIWSTYFGDSGDDYINQIALDKVGNIIIGGYVNSNNLPVDINSYQKQNKGGYDFYIAKFSSDFKLIWSTYIGGTSDDYLITLGIDADDNIWVSVEINSNDFPTTSNAVTKTHSGGTKDIIISKLSKNGQLEYSTYLGGSNYESVPLIAFDYERNVYFGGRSWSNNFPTTAGAYQKNKLGYYDGILVKFNIDSYKYYGTYVGITNNSGTDNLYIEALTIDSQNNIIIGGHTNSSKLTMVNSKLGDKFKGIYDAYLIKFDHSMNIIWSNYYGGSKNDRLSKIDCDENGNLYGIGFTKSIDLEMKNSFDSVHQSFEDAFLFKINSSGELQWSKYLGGNRTEGNQMDDDNIDRIYADIKYFNNKIGIVFKTNSSDLPLIGNNYYSKDYLGGQYDVYSMILSADGVPIQSTYIGGNNLDIAYSSIFTKDFIFICGNTNSTNINTTTNAFQSNYKSGIDGFVIKFKVTEIKPDDDKPPVIFSQSDSCNVFRVITVTDEEINDRGIKSIEVIMSENCKIQIIHYSIKRKIIEIKLYDEGAAGTYSIKVLDSSDNIQMIDGVLLPNPSIRISFNPADTLFVSPTPPGAMICDSLTLTNINEFELLISDIYLHSNIKFSVPSHQFPITIPPNGKANLAICFYSEQLVSNKYFDSLEYRTDCYTKGLVLASETILEDVYVNSKCEQPLLISFDSNSIKSFMIYPNPVKNNLRFSFKNNTESPTNIIIYNILGETVFENNYNSKPKVNDLQIDVSSFSNGYYFIVLYSGQKYYYEKFIISR